MSSVWHVIVCPYFLAHATLCPGFGVLRRATVARLRRVKSLIDSDMGVVRSAVAKFFFSVVQACLNEPFYCSSVTSLLGQMNLATVLVDQVVACGVGCGCSVA